MKQSEQLQEALDHVIEAESIITELMKNSSDSLNNYHGYSLLLMQQQLNIMSGNKGWFLTKETTIEQIIAGEGDEWYDNRVCHC